MNNLDSLNPISLTQVISCAPDKELELYKNKVEKLYFESNDLEWTLPLAVALWRLNLIDETYQILKKGIHKFIADYHFLVLLGMVSKKLGNISEARINYHRACQLEPKRADLYYNLGNLELDDDPETAERTFIISLKCDNSRAPTWHNFGITLNHQQRYIEAQDAFKLSLTLDPAIADVWCNLGLAYYGEQQFDAAMDCFKHAITLENNHGASHINMGNALISILRPEEALMYLKKGKELEESSANSLWNLSLAYLLLGEFNEGWKYYESRFATKSFQALSCPTVGPKPDKLVECPKNDSPPLVVWTEQGIGDAIQFGRYLFLLDSASINFVFTTRPTLLKLFRDWFGLGERVKEQVKKTDQEDKRPQIALLSLPYLFRTELETIPSSVPYLKQPSTVPDNLSIIQPPGGLSVGLVWATNPENKKMYKNKSIPLDMLMPRLLKLLDLDLIDLHSLQVGSDAEQLDPWSNHARITDWSKRLQDFSDTAYVLNQLDLIISVDTAVAHLAGALKRPTWLLLPHNADFRWLRDQSSSPWYPTMRLFRQANLKDWLSVAQEINQAFNDLFLLDIDQLVSEKLNEF